MALSKIGTSETSKATGIEIPTLIKLLQYKSESFFVHDIFARTKATRTSGNIGENAVPALVQTLKEPDEDVRGNVVMALSIIRLVESIVGSERPCDCGICIRTDRYT